MLEGRLETIEIPAQKEVYNKEKQSTEIKHYFREVTREIYESFRMVPAGKIRYFYSMYNTKNPIYAKD